MVKVQPTELFASIVKMAGFCSSVVGCDVANPNFRVNWITRVVLFFVAMTFSLTMLNVVNSFKSDWTAGLEAFCMVGGVLQGITKLCSGIFQTKDLVDLRFLLERLYADYQKRGAAYSEALTKSCLQLKYVVKVVIMIYLVSCVGVMVVPFIMLLFTGQRHMMMHFVIPFLDVSTNFGYFTTLGVHTICVLIAGFGLFAGDLFFLLFLTQSLMFVDILKLKNGELNESCKLKKRVSLELLKDVIRWHQFYTEYNEKCNAIFYYIVTVQVTTSAVNMLCTLCVFLFSDWPGVYSYMLLASSGLYVYCILGTRIETCNDEFCEEIYNIDWYNLPVGEQKMVSIMLAKAQCPSNIKIGGVLPLSVNTALRITKTIYSTFMMLVQFAEE